MSKRTTSRIATTAGMTLLAAQAFAQYGGNEGQIDNFLSQSTTWLITHLGPSFFVLGIIGVAVSLMWGNEDALRKSGLVVLGGTLIFLSEAVMALLKRLAGGF